MRLRFSLRTLLIVATLAAIAVFVATRLDSTMCWFVGIVASVASAGYVAGWVSRIKYEQKGNVLLLTTAFVAFNWSLWLLTESALSFVRNSPLQLIGILTLLASIDHQHFFDAMAVLFTLAIVLASLQGKRQWIFASGATCVLFWLIITIVGFVTASACLLDLQ